MLPVRLRPAAVADLSDAWGWYEDQRGGLGDEFSTCVDAAMAELGRDPFLCPKVRGEARRKVLRRFPYSLIYLTGSEHVEIIAVIHFSRDPKSWASRLGS